VVKAPIRAPHVPVEEQENIREHRDSSLADSENADLGKPGSAHFLSFIFPTTPIS
jgi:hypothetical protein